MRRLIRGLAAALAVAIIVVGGAIGLLRWGRLDLIAVTDWRAVVSRPDDGSLLLALLSVIGWLAWLLIALSLLTEALVVITRGRWHIRLPGTGVFAPASAVLVAAIAGLVAAQLPGQPPWGGHVMTSGGPTGRSAASSGVAASHPALTRPGTPMGASSPTNAVDPGVQSGEGTDGRRAPGPEETATGSREFDAANSRAADTPPIGDDVSRPGAGAAHRSPDSSLLDHTAASRLRDPSDAAQPSIGQDSEPASAAGDGWATPAGEAGRGATSAEAASGHGPHWYTIGPGDDLWTLAEEHFGDGSRWRDIQAANATLLLDATAPLQPGQVIELPDPRAHLAPASAITVQPGDTLWDLSATHLGDPTRWSELAAANPALIEPDLIYPGQALRLPGGEGNQLAGAIPDEMASGQAGNDKKVAGDRVADVGATRGGVPDDETATSTGAEGGQDVSDGEVPSRPEQVSVSVPTPSLQPPGSDGVPASTDAASSPSTDAASSAAGMPGIGTSSQSAAIAPPSPQVTDAGWQVSPPSVPDSAAVESAGELDDGAMESQAGDPEPQIDLRPVLGPIGVSLASALVAGLAFRRRGQRFHRPLGRRTPASSSSTQHVITALRQVPDGDRTRSNEALPGEVGSESGPAVLTFAGQHDPPEQHPGPCDPALLTDPALLIDPSPLSDPIGLPSIGQQCAEQVLVLGCAGEDEVTVPANPGVLRVVTEDADVGGGLLASLALQSSGLGLGIDTIVGGDSLGWLRSVEEPDLEVVEADVALKRLNEDLVRRSAVGVPGLGRCYVFDRLPGDLDIHRVASAGLLIIGQVRVPLEMATHQPDTPEMVEVELFGETGSIDHRSFEPQLILPPARRALVEEFTTANATDYPPAPWWGAPDSGPEPGDVIPLHPGARREDCEEDLVPAPRPPDAPYLLLLGPVELVGAHGEPPTKAAKQCLEYCAWILTHPGRTAPMMTRSLLVAETTRRSNMSRLRGWLGVGVDGEPYLPDAYSGHIALHPAVSSDWEQFQLTLAGGVDRASDERLHAALRMVRGAPLADAAPGQWHWAEQLRVEMVEMIRDAAVVLGNHALDRADLPLARWAAARGLVAAPEDEQLMGLRIRTEHLAGNRPEVERLVLHVTRQARLLGVDLSDDFVILLQEIMEGQARARLA